MNINVMCTLTSLAVRRMDDVLKILAGGSSAKEYFEFELRDANEAYEELMGCTYEKADAYFNRKTFRVVSSL